MRNFFRRLSPRHWAWAHVLAVVGIWWPLFVIFTPPEFLQNNVDPILLLICMWIATFGSALKIGGFLSSQQPGRLGVIGVSVELVGLILSVLGPIAYIFSYLYVLLATDTDLAFGSGLILAYGVLSIYLYRAIILVPRFLKEAHDPAKE